MDLCADGQIEQHSFLGEFETSSLGQCKWAAHLGTKLCDLQEGEFCVWGNVFYSHQQPRHHPVEPADLPKPAECHRRPSPQYIATPSRWRHCAGGADSHPGPKVCGCEGSSKTMTRSVEILRLLTEGLMTRSCRARTQHTPAKGGLLHKYHMQHEPLHLSVKQCSPAQCRHLFSYHVPRREQGDSQEFECQ